MFSGRCDPAAVRCLLATLDEADLRGLREQLRDGLTTAVPATAGRPLRIRQSGNVGALADDCWELGYSAAQGQLTRWVDSGVLKPAGRSALPSSSEAELLSSQASAANAESSLRSIIETQLRMDSEMAELRRRVADAVSQRARIQRLEERISELHLACTDRDARIAQLETSLRGGLDQQPVGRPGSGDNSAASPSQARAPAAGSGAETQSKARPPSAVDIAAVIDVRSLG